MFPRHKDNPIRVLDNEPSDAELTHEYEQRILDLLIPNRCSATSEGILALFVLFAVRFVPEFRIQTPVDRQKAGAERKLARYFVQETVRELMESGMPKNRAIAICKLAFPETKVKTIRNAVTPSAARLMPRDLARLAYENRAQKAILRAIKQIIRTAPNLKNRFKREVEQMIGKQKHRNGRDGVRVNVYFPEPDY